MSLIKCGKSVDIVDEGSSNVEINSVKSSQNQHMELDENEEMEHRNKKSYSIINVPQKCVNESISEYYSFYKTRAVVQ
ncbi:2271_t:CDS:2 [Paraglomus brasilianum]|uniref:2271_t:CDS:1 n=1 Tax=Paraglomus brasilianum TaxID=144538 RepID=A0A9N8ZZV5_9GLOM|nr:2271_t:CDS:2 [Paraglomus brasilianum]